MIDEHRAAMDKALRFLSARAHSTRELRDKLLTRDFSMGVVDSVLEECARRGFLNDRLFAEFCLEEFKGRGYGPRKCMMYLRNKGIESAMIEEVMAEKHDATDELSQAEEVMRRKLRSLARESDPMKKKEKAIRFMAGRGFSFELANRVYARLTQKE